MKTKILLLLILLLPLISCNGLKITQENIWTNKTYGDTFKVKINVTNEDSFKFYNITFEQSNIATTPKFDLESGQSKEIEVTIIGNEDYNGVLTLRGEYYTNIGSSNKTETVQISYSSGFDRCNLDLIKGDKILWINNVLGDIELINADTDANIISIPEGQNRTYQLNNPTELNYYARWVGYKFTNTCKLNIMNDNGLVHKSEYDDTINLDLKILYEPTTIETTFLTNSFEIEYNEKENDIFKIKNTGSKTAKNIKINGDWFTFKKDGITVTSFDLNAGDSATIDYSMQPSITNTSQTNKTYNKTITITGNFNTINQPISIFVPYRNVNIYMSGEIDEEVIENFIKLYCANDVDKCIALLCSVFPDECNNGTFGSGKVTQEFDKDAVQSMMESYAKQLSEQQQEKKLTTQTDIEQTEIVKNSSNTTSTLAEEVRQLREDINKSKENDNFKVGVMIFLVILVVAILILSNSDIKEKVKDKIHLWG